MVRHNKYEYSHSQKVREETQILVIDHLGKGTSETESIPKTDRERRHRSLDEEQFREEDGPLIRNHIRIIVMRFK